MKTQADKKITDHSIKKYNMGSIFDDVLEKVDRGRAGLNVGLPMGFNRLVEYLPNIQQGTYYLIGAGTKVWRRIFFFMN